MTGDGAPFLPYGRHQVDDADVEAVAAVLRSDFLTTGPAVEEFERAVAERVGARHAVACSSGTAALHLAALALGLEPGDGVVIMSYNRPEWFISNLAAIAAGGLPAGIYTSCTAEQCRYITDHCEARIAVLENTEYLDRFREIRSSLPRR